MDIMSGQKYALTGQILGRPDTLSGSFTLLMNQILFKFIEIHVCHNKLFGIVWQRGVSKQNRCNWNLTGASRKIIQALCLESVSEIKTAMIDCKAMW